MTGWPRITVVTPSFNQVEYLEETLETIHGQGYPELEHIVMDGGSTDGSVDVIRRWAEHLDYWQSEPDGGQTSALRRGFELATGEILCWLNSDDLYEPWTLREVGEFFLSNPEAEVVYGDSTWISDTGEFIRPKREHPFSRFIFLYDHDFIPQPSTFWRAGLYQRVGGLDPSFDLAMDADLFIRFADVTKVHHRRRPWSRMRLYPDQKNQRLRSKSNLEGRRIRSRYLGDKSDSSLRWRHQAARALRIGWKVTTGRYSPADLRSRLPGGATRRLTNPR